MQTSTGIIRQKSFRDFGKEVVLNVSNNVFSFYQVSIFFFYFFFFFILKRLQAVTSYCYRYSVIFSLVSFLSILSRIMP